MSCPYEQYYTHQAGSGVGIIYKGAIHQRGHGIGSFWEVYSDLFYHY